MNDLTRAEQRELELRAQGDARTGWPADTPAAVAELARRGLLDHLGCVTPRGHDVLAGARKGGRR